MTDTFDSTTEGAVLAELRAIRSLLASQQAELLTGKAAARFLGVSLATLYRLSSRFDTLRPVTVGQGCKRWKRTALAKYVADLRT